MRTGHDRNNEDVLRVETVLFREVGFYDRALHLVRGFAGRKVVEQIAVIILGEVDPSGRAGRYHRKIFAGFKSGEKFRPLFHDRQVCAEVGVVNSVEAETSEPCFTLKKFARDGVTIAIVIKEEELKYE